jgi:energy-converting hydrogenase A subunit R
VKRIFISDCEGPISKNDNAFEIMSQFVPDGDKIYSVTSRYDDALADVLKKAGYKAGDTLKLILPFLKAYDVTDEKMREFSAQNLIFIRNAKKSLLHIRNIAPAYIVSTSYEHYIRVLCEALEFPFKNIYCTKLRLDKYKMSQQEKTEVRKLGREIAEMSVFEIPSAVRTLTDLPETSRATIEKLDEIYWERIADMRIGEVYMEINPIGGFEKADAINDAVDTRGVTLADVMYVGDSITDEEAFKLVKEGDGLTVSFNGNHYAVNNSEIAIMSTDSLITAIVADIFIKYGREKTLDLVARWNRKTLRESTADHELVTSFLKMHPKELAKAKIIIPENRESLAKESSEFRRKVRGVAIGRLG